jgi:hypothetical protein
VLEILGRRGGSSYVHFKATALAVVSALVEADASLGRLYFIDPIVKPLLVLVAWSSAVPLNADGHLVDESELGLCVETIHSLLLQPQVDGPSFFLTMHRATTRCHQPTI